MAKYIKVKDAIEAAINGCASWDGGYFPSMDDPIKEEFDVIADKCIELVTCGECKHFIEPSWECRKLIDRDAYGEADARVYPDYFCADGERKDGETEQCNTYSLGKIEMPKGAMKQIIADGERRTDGK